RSRTPAAPVGALRPAPGSPGRADTRSTLAVGAPAAPLGIVGWRNWAVISSFYARRQMTAASSSWTPRGDRAQARFSRRDEGAGDSAEAAAAGTVSDGIARRQGGSFATARRRGPTRLTQSCEAWRAGAQLNTDGGPSCRRAPTTRDARC